MRKAMIFGVFLWMALAGAAFAQEGSLRFEKTVDWQTGKLIKLDALVGPVRIGSVELSNQGKGGGGIASRRGDARDDVPLVHLDAGDRSRPLDRDPQRAERRLRPGVAAVPQEQSHGECHPPSRDHAAVVLSFEDHGYLRRYPLSSRSVATGDRKLAEPHCTRSCTAVCAGNGGMTFGPRSLNDSRQ